ncbi:MAG: aminotransferase class V-fold PLP-dependent enzyme [Candidatus Onthomonas sp.]
MIYLDSAATALQKPPQVARAMVWATQNCASPGRGNYAAAIQAAETAFRCRTALAELLGAAGPEQVIFTSSATHGLNIAIRSLVQPGDRVVISGYEHNAVTRTLTSIPNVDQQVAVGCLFDPEADLTAFARALEQPARAVICTHVSNVFGYILPISGIAQLCRARQIPLIVDASQSAGILPVDLEGWGAEYVALPGHKGLCGPQGIGVLLCGKNSNPDPLLTGGTGSESLLQAMPDFLPDRLEAGTHNLPGIAGLLAGVRFIQQQGPERLLKGEQALIRQLRSQLSRLHGLEMICPEDSALATGVLSFRLAGQDCEEAAEQLGRRGIALRAGLHCAPLAHRTAGTLETGTIRASVSPFSRPEELRALTGALRQMSEK